MKEFLNDYTAWNLDLERESARKLTQIFEATTALIHESFGDRAFRPARAVNAAVVDSLMTVVAEGIQAESLRSPKSLEKAYDRLFRNAEYRSAIEKATAREENVKLRLKKARELLLR